MRSGWLLPLLALVVMVAAPARAEQGVTDTEILLGGSNSFSGPLAFTGEQITKFGVDLGFKAVNDGGGIHGRKVRTIWYDDGYKPQDAVANTRKLVEQDQVFAVIIPQGAPPVVATLEYLEQNRVPLLFPYQSSTVTRGRHWVFQGMTMSDRSSRMMIDYLVGRRKYGLRLLAVESVKRGVTDVSAQIAKLHTAKPEVTFLVLVPGPGAQALRERQKIGWTDTLMVSTGPLTDERYLSLAGDAAEGVEGLSLWPDPLTSDLPGVRRYREHMQNYFPRNEPNRYSLAGYFAAMLFAEGATRAGARLTRESLIAALQSVKRWESGILPPLTIGPDHETQKQAVWVRVERGRFKQLTDWLRAE